MRSDRLRRCGAAARRGWAYLVGAGPGDPDLITVRAEQLLTTADVVLYDEALDADLLRRAKGKLVAVEQRGSDPDNKNAKHNSMVQELLGFSRAGNSVVRLTAGDPFIFGPGAEEADALRQANIPFEVVPGVVSPAGAACAGIPLTQRSLAGSVTFVAAVSPGGTDFPWQQLRGLRGTLCVFTGQRPLAEIAQSLMAEGNVAANTPVATIEKISCPSQRTVEGTLGGIAEGLEAAQFGSPSLLFVGDVVGLRANLRWFDRRPLFGKRVLLTRPAAQIHDTTQLFRRRGAEVLAVPLIKTQAPVDQQVVASLVPRIAQYDLVLFTSVNGVRWLWHSIEEQGRDARVFGGAQVGTIGPATADALHEKGIVADFVAGKHIAEELAATVCARFQAGTRVLLPRAQVAREVLPQQLRAAQMHVDVVAVYETVAANRARLVQALQDCDIITLTSSSTAEQLFQACSGDMSLLENKMLASIGPITTATAEKLGMLVAVTASVHDTQGLVDALETHLCALNEMP